MRQAILLGDRRPFIAALIVPERKKIAVELHKEESALTESEIAAAFQSRIDQINARLEQFEKIRNSQWCRTTFQTTVRSVTVFQKIKIDRKAVEQRYQKEINTIYPRHCRRTREYEPNCVNHRRGRWNRRCRSPQNGGCWDHSYCHRL